jgi:hypothetical protein
MEEAAGFISTGPFSPRTPRFDRCISKTAAAS